MTFARKWALFRITVRRLCTSTGIHAEAENRTLLNKRRVLASYEQRKLYNTDCVWPFTVPCTGHTLTVLAKSANDALLSAAYSVYDIVSTI